ncbi:hypothetical protein D3C78_1765410 [compost metagenome]
MIRLQTEVRGEGEVIVSQCRSTNRPGIEIQIFRVVSADDCLVSLFDSYSFAFIVLLTTEMFDVCTTSCIGDFQ